MQQIVRKLNLRKQFDNEELRNKLKMAGLRGEGPLVAFMFFRAAAPPLSFVAALIYVFLVADIEQSDSMKLLYATLAGAAGYYLPNVFIENLAQKRQQAIKIAFPEALDMLLICVQSGMSVEAAFGKAAKEIANQSIELSEELSLTTAELSYLPDRRLAFENFAKRTALPTVKAVTTALIQADRYGTPVGQALRVMAKENRDIRMGEAEKKAAALPPKLTVPMIVFFLPVLFLVILGPAAITYFKMQYAAASSHKAFLSRPVCVTAAQCSAMIVTDGQRRKRRRLNSPASSTQRVGGGRPLPTAAERADQCTSASSWLMPELRRWIANPHAAMPSSPARSGPKRASEDRLEGAKPRQQGLPRLLGARTATPLFRCWRRRRNRSRPCLRAAPAQPCTTGGARLGPAGAWNRGLRRDNGWSPRVRRRPCWRHRGGLASSLTNFFRNAVLAWAWAASRSTDAIFVASSYLPCSPRTNARFWRTLAFSLPDGGSLPQKLLAALRLSAHRVGEREVVQHRRMPRLERLRALVERDRLAIAAFLGKRRASRKNDAPIRIGRIVRHRQQLLRERRFGRVQARRRP